MATYKVVGGYLDVEEAGKPVDPGAHPEHPIVIPIPPGVINPDPPIPTHPIYLPVYPMHPIVIPPGSIGGDPPKPEHPIVLPPYVPGHPIVIPPGIIDGVHPEHPIYLPPVISGGPGSLPPWVMPPIFYPPSQPPSGGGGAGSGKWVYSPAYGWVWDPGEGGKPQPLPPTSETPPAGRRG